MLFFRHCKQIFAKFAWQSKGKFALNSWILRYAQYDKIYDTKSVWYDKTSQYDKFGALLEFL